MQSFKTNLYVAFICLALGLTIGRYTNRGVSQTTDITKDHDVAQDTKKITVIITAPDGKKTTTQTTEIDTHVSTDTKKSVDTIVPAKKPVLNFSVLAGDQLNSPFKFVYGVSVSKEVLGPINVGLFALTNSTIGVSVGLNF
jgi:hypothetical protein